MSWNSDMACGVHLGILLIFLIQAEHICCLWSAQAQRQNSNTNVGFSQQDNEFGGRRPQNQLRQASVSPGSAQRSSFNTDTAVSSGYGQGLSSRGLAKSASQPAKSGYASVKLVQSSSASKPNWRPLKSNQETAPKKQFSLSTSIASGSSVSKYDQKPSSKKQPVPVQQGTTRTSKYPSSSSSSLQSPSRGSYSYKPASHQLAVQKTAAVTPAYYGQSYRPPVKSSGLFSAGSSVSNKGPVRTRTSASAPAKRVSLKNGYAASKPSRFASLPTDRTGNDPSKTGAGKPYRSRLFPVNAGRPATTSHMASNRVVGYSKSLPVSSKQSAANTDFQPRSLKTATSSLQASQGHRNSAQGAHNLHASGTSGQKFAPTRIHKIPQRFGGHAIRRLKEPEQKVSVGKPKLAYVTPQRPMAPQRPAAAQAYVPPQRPMAPQRPAAAQAYVPPQRPMAPQRPAAPQAYVPPQAYVTPQRPVDPQRPAAPQAYVPPQRPAAAQAYVPPQRPAAAQAYVPPQRPAAPQAYVTPQRPAAPQAYVTPQRPMAPQRPAAPQAYVTPQRPMAPQRPAAPQAYVTPQRPMATQRPAAPQAYMAPQKLSVTSKPEVQSVHQPSKWRRIKPNFKL